MAVKANFLAIAVSLVFFILIANAYPEEGINEDSVNETLDFNNLSNDVNDSGNVEITSEQGNIENIQNNENKGKAVTASFGVYLEIVG